MTRPILEDAIGVIDGVNDIFETSEDYAPGQVWWYLNGQLQQQSDLVELGDKQIQLLTVPEIQPTGDPDTVHFYYAREGGYGGAMYGPPRLLEMIDLTPRVNPVALVPRMVSAEEV